MGSLSIVKWAPFQLSKFGKCARSGPLFDCQMGPFSVDKNKQEWKEILRYGRQKAKEKGISEDQIEDIVDAYRK